MGYRADKAESIDDLRAAARRRLPGMLFDFIDGGADEEVTARRNVLALRNAALVPRVLSPTPERRQDVELFGERLRLPVLIAPTGFSGIFWPRAEAAVARAAAAAGTVMTVSAAASLSLEDVAAASDGPKWFQLFIYRERRITEALAGRAAAAGYKALCVTVDVQAGSHRPRDIRNGFTVPPRFRLHAAADLARRVPYLLQMARHGPIGFPNFAGYASLSGLAVSAFQQGLIDPTVGWEDLRWLRKLWQGPLIVKGVLHADDARLAVEHGVDAVVISNHGGRQLDGVPSTFEALPGAVEAVRGRIPVLIDGGIRNGRDVLKCIAQGARACLIGRSYLWGLASAGEAGVRRALQLFTEDIDRSLALGGWNSLADLHTSDLRLRPGEAATPYPPARPSGPVNGEQYP